jgi:hypothetical protein
VKQRERTSGIKQPGPDGRMGRPSIKEFITSYASWHEKAVPGSGRSEGRGNKLPRWGTISALEADGAFPAVRGRSHDRSKIVENWRWLRVDGFF